MVDDAAEATPHTAMMRGRIRRGRRLIEPWETRAVGVDRRGRGRSMTRATSGARPGVTVGREGRDDDVVDLAPVRPASSRRQRARASRVDVSSPLEVAALADAGAAIHSSLVSGAARVW
jgi:hypothetical protein